MEPRPNFPLPLRILAGTGALALVIAVASCEYDSSEDYHGGARNVHAGAEVFDRYPRNDMTQENNCAVTDGAHTATPDQQAAHIVKDDQTGDQTSHTVYAYRFTPKQLGIPGKDLKWPCGTMNKHVWVQSSDTN